jgi:WD40 repeat protein
MFDRRRVGVHRKVFYKVENEKPIKSDGEQTRQANDGAGSAISRRQFSLGLSRILLAGTVLESAEHNTLSALAAKTSSLPAQPGPQKLMPHAFGQPQYVLSGTTASVWSPDSRRIATFQENRVTLYNANTGKSELTYSKHTDEILTVKWSADSKYLASSGFDHIVHVWDAVLGQTLTMYKGHTAIVRDIVWSPNQQYLASAGYDKTVQVWEALTGIMVVTYSGHAAEIHALTWSPDSRLIASTDLQNKTMIWRII